MNLKCCDMDYKEKVIALLNSKELSKEQKEKLEDIFPELKESEDEKTRKAIKYGLDHVFTNNTTVFGVTKEQCLAWLENQGEHKSIWHNEDEEPQKGSLILLIMQSGTPVVAKIIESNHTFNHGERWAYIDDLLESKSEQKPADKVGPKFHEGEWIIHQGTENIYQVVAIIDNQYQLKYGDNYTTQYCEDVDRCTRLWDITKDAKDGDVLVASDKSLFIYDGSMNENGSVGFHIAFAKDTDIILNSDDGCGWEEKDSCHPATKEQRDALMKAMADAGYTFDFKKKELKKIEQKPVWSEEDETVRNDIIAKLAILKSRAVDGGAEKEICEMEINWLESLKERYTWKPSDEQMHYLSWIANVKLGDSLVEQEVSKHLNELLEDLMKLKG